LVAAAAAVAFTAAAMISPAEPDIPDDTSPESPPPAVLVQTDG